MNVASRNIKGLSKTIVQIEVLKSPVARLAQVPLRRLSLVPPLEASRFPQGHGWSTNSSSAAASEEEEEEEEESRLLLLDGAGFDGGEDAERWAQGPDNGRDGVDGDGTMAYEAPNDDR